jgi:hypothetical protein
MMTSRDQLHLWVLLEAHPRVTRYCERPTWPNDVESSSGADFWISGRYETAAFMSTGRFYLLYGELVSPIALACRRGGLRL